MSLLYSPRILERSLAIEIELFTRRTVTSSWKQHLSITSSLTDDDAEEEAEEGGLREEGLVPEADEEALPAAPDPDADVEADPD